MNQEGNDHSACRPTTCDLVVASRNWREFRVGLIVNTDFVYLIFLNPVCSLSKCWGRECQLVEEMATATTQVVQGKGQVERVESEMCGVASPCFPARPCSPAPILRSRLARRWFLSSGSFRGGASSLVVLSPFRFVFSKAMFCIPLCSQTL
ncbi:hypothetical protein E2C01_001105 [Portunus trituberculatus]|uniref:Uncharacterized protein n=1 Tax=Portunus trituberculatus TaxID=210409 RepID=A0A5B7CH24_PORTR|nr:hypothetical protein [Portunus trituberculatus]